MPSLPGPPWVMTGLCLQNGEFNVFDFDSEDGYVTQMGFGDSLAALKYLLEDQLCQDDQVRIGLGFPATKLFMGSVTGAHKWLMALPEVAGD